MDEETRWLSYEEIAEIRRIGRESAARIARLKRWPKRTGNDGTIRVAVPLNFLEGKRRAQTEHPPEVRPETTRK